MSDATSFLKERPVVAGGIVLAVALLAYLSSRKSGSGSPSETTDVAFRGDAARSIDPNAAAISQAQISAGTSNLATIAQLAGLQDSNANALAGTLAQTNAAENVSLAQTSAQRDVSLSSIAANLRASLFSTEAQKEESLFSTQSSLTASENANATSLEQARITDAFNRATLDTQSYIAKLQQEAEIRGAEAQRDAVRSQAKSSFWGSVIGGLEVGLGALV